MWLLVVIGAVEDQRAIDEHPLGVGVDAEGVADQITTSAFLPASSEPVTFSIPSALAGLIEIHFTASARLDRDPGLGPARIALAASWLSRCVPSALSEWTMAQPLGLVDERDVLRDAVVGLELEPPPVGPHARADVVGDEQIADLVGLDRVMERGDLVAELLRDVDHRRHLVGAIAVVVDQDLAVEDAGQRFELEVAIGTLAPDPDPSAFHLRHLSRYSTAACQALR